MEQIIDELNNYIAKISEEYMAKLNAMARELLANHQGQSDIDEKMLEEYLKEQEAKFNDMLNEKLESIHKYLEEMTSNTDVTKEKAYDRIAKSFSKIFKSVAEKLNSLFNKA